MFLYVERQFSRAQEKALHAWGSSDIIGRTIDGTRFFYLGICGRPLRRLSTLAGGRGGARFYMQRVSLG